MMISETINELAIISAKQKTVKDFCIRTMSPLDYIRIRFTQSQKQRHQHLFTKYRTSHQRKFNNLLDSKFGTLKELVKDEWVSNLSDTEIPENVMIVLSLGPNFGLPYEYKELPIVRTVASIECSLYSNDNRYDDVKAECANIITNYLNGYAVSKSSDKLLLQLVKQQEFS